jgi:hypothetical protein
MVSGFGVISVYMLMMGLPVLIISIQFRVQIYVLPFHFSYDKGKLPLKYRANEAPKEKNKNQK